ncbi:hypothetical protein HFN87_27705 [Rhizobium laguerreae]|uniref:TniQ family protein n=1 Tax=Rhizobium laguerreae TaxID=1076926 RepID=UPI001C907A5D|nr:TniQ family protein [Rhizobium laguerreae]MBY3417048.1 hypothetical protein [Rhizobium laguerreae]
MVQLANVPCLMPTEPLPNFISRLAAVNGARSLQDFRRHFMLKTHKSYGTQDLFSRIRKLTGIPEDILASHSIFNATGHSELSHTKLRWTNLHTSSARYCPLCIQNDYLRQDESIKGRYWVRGGWHAANNQVCVEHSVELFTSPIAYNAGNRWDFSKHIRDNAMEVEKAAASATNCELHSYDRYFDRRITGSFQDLQFLDPLPYHIAYRLCELIGQMKLGSDTVDLRRMHKARCEGFDILSDNGKLLGYLDELRDRHLARTKTSSRYFVYGPFERYLAQLIEIPDAKPLINTVRDHAMRALPIGPKDDFLGGGGVRKWHTVRTAKLEFDIDPRLMRKMMIERGIITESQMVLKDNEILVPAAEVESLANAYGDSVDLQYVKNTFGVVEATARQLINIGVIEPIYGAIAGMKARFSRTAIDATLEAVVSGLAEVAEDGHLVSLFDAIRLGPKSKANLIAALVDRTISPRGLSMQPDRVGFMRLLLDPADIRREFIKPVDIKRHEFRAIFQLRPHEVDDFFYSQFFKQKRERSPTNHREFDVVTRDSLLRFQQDHVSLAAAAKGWGRSVDMKTRLDAVGIVPVWQIPGRRVLTFYRRNEVEAFLSNHR